MARVRRHRCTETLYKRAAVRLCCQQTAARPRSPMLLVLPPPQEIELPAQQQEEREEQDKEEQGKSCSRGCLHKRLVVAIARMVTVTIAALVAAAVVHTRSHS